MDVIQTFDYFNGVNTLLILTSCMHMDVAFEQIVALGYINDTRGDTTYIELNTLVMRPIPITSKTNIHTLATTLPLCKHLYI